MWTFNVHNSPKRRATDTMQSTMTLIQPQCEFQHNSAAPRGQTSPNNFRSRACATQDITNSPQWTKRQPFQTVFNFKQLHRRINKHTDSDGCDALLSLPRYTAAAVNYVSDPRRPQKSPLLHSSFRPKHRDPSDKSNVESRGVFGLFLFTIYSVRFPIKGR